MFSQGYWIDTQLCILVLWLFYLAALHRRIPFATARGYLLAMLPVGLLLPLVQIPVLPAPEPETAIQVPGLFLWEEGEPIRLAPVVQPTIDWTTTMLWMLYLLGVVTVGLFQTIRILRIRGGFRGTRPGDVLFSDTVPGAYSAFGRIVVNDKYEESPMLGTILAHERSHIAHRHAWDLLWMSLWRSLLWFHPAAWHGGKLLREVHEFQADSDVIRQGYPVGPYLDLLIGTEAGFYPGTVSALCYSLTKKRLKMMTRTHRGSKLGRCFRLAALPFVGGTLLCAFSFTAQAADPQPQIEEPSTFQPADSTPKTYTIVYQKPDSLSRIEPDVQPLYVDGQKIDVKNDTLSIRRKETSEDPLIIIDGKVVDPAQQVDLTSLDPQKITILKGQTAIDQLGEQGAHGAIVITTEKKAGSVRKGSGVYYGTYTPDDPSKDTLRIYYGTYRPGEPIDREQLRKTSETLRQEMREMALRLKIQSDSLRQIAQALAEDAQMRAKSLRAETAALSQRAQQYRKGWMVPGLTVSGKGSSLYYRSWENKKAKPIETVSNKRQVTIYLTREEQEQGITPGAKLLKDCPKMFYLEGTTVRNIDPIRVNVYLENRE